MKSGYSSLDEKSFKISLASWCKAMARELSDYTAEGLYGTDGARLTADALILTLTHTAAELQKKAK